MNINWKLLSFILIAAIITSVSVGVPSIPAAIAAVIAEPNTVNSAAIINGEVRTADLANGNVTTAKIANDAITSAKIGSSQVRTTDIANGNVTGPKISNSAITADKVSTKFILHRVLLDDEIGNAHGWNPNDNTTVFSIEDPAFNVLDSTVFVNILDPEFDTCSVDYRFKGGFEIHCAVDFQDFEDNPPSTAPDDGAVLHYVIITEPATPFPDVSLLSAPVSSNGGR